MFLKLISIILFVNCFIQNTDLKDVKTLRNDIENVEERKISNFKEILKKMLKKLDLNSGNGREKRHTPGGKRKHFDKLHMAPLIFKMGAASTWMLLTAFLAAKSVAIGLMLLVLKIVLNFAKLTSIFSLLKHKHHHKPEEYWSWAPPHHASHEYHPHHDAHDHHGYDYPPFHDRDGITSAFNDEPRIDTTGWHTHSKTFPQPGQWIPEPEDDEL